MPYRWKIFELCTFHFLLLSERVSQSSLATKCTDCVRLYFWWCGECFASCKWWYFRNFKRLQKPVNSLSWQLTAVTEPGRCPRAGRWPQKVIGSIPVAWGRINYTCVTRFWYLFNFLLKKGGSSLIEKMPTPAQTTHSFALLLSWLQNIS